MQDFRADASDMFKLMMNLENSECALADKETSKNADRKQNRPRDRMYTMKEGGAVPPNRKGFSQLPEEVQMKMDPKAAMKYMEGGAVKAV